MLIIMPSEEEKKRSVSYIVSKGLSPRRHFLHDIVVSIKSFGLHLMDGTGIALLSAVGLFTLLILYPDWVNISIDLGSMFAISGFCYIVLIALSEWENRTNRMYELKKTFKHHPNQLIVLKLMVFALIGLVFSSISSFVYADDQIGVNFIDCFMISLSGMLLTSLLSLYVVFYVKKIRGYILAFLLWLSVFVVPAFVISQLWDMFLAKLPDLVVLSLIVIVLAGNLYVWRRSFYQYQKGDQFSC